MKKKMEFVFFLPRVGSGELCCSTRLGGPDWGGGLSYVRALTCGIEAVLGRVLAKVGYFFITTHSPTWNVGILCCCCISVQTRLVNFSLLF